MAKDGPQPHVHIMFSARNVGDGSRGEQAFFRKPQTVDPARGGFGKERFFNQQDAPLRLRLAWTDVTNMALERAGAARRVTADALHRQGLRPLYAYQQPGDYRHQAQDYAPRTPDEQGQQQAYAAAQWEARKQALGLVVTATPVNPQQFGRLVKEGKGTPKARAQDAPAISVADLTRRWALPLIGNKRSGIYHTYEHKNYGEVHPKNQVRFWTEQEAQDAGYRRAVNEHYGRGSGKPMTVEEATTHLRAMQATYGQPQGILGRLLGSLRHPTKGHDAEGAGGELRVRLYRDKERAHGMGW
jgi:hypothetical protein